jgi:imidazolonepropionase-like amidohydrolase
MNFRRTNIIIFAISVGCTHAYRLSAADPKDVAYVGATVFDGVGAAGRPDQVIVTRADRILAILPATEYRTLTAKLAGEAYRVGIPISAGTDDEPGDSNDTYSALSQEIIFLVDGAGLAPADAIRAATLNGARTVGRREDMGSIEVGKLADFVVLDKDPLSDIRNIRSVYMTVKNGVGYKRSQYQATPISPDHP